jgi:hypothetical protein
MVMVCYFEVILKKFNVVGIYKNGNYAHKWINKLYNYSFVVPAVITTGKVGIINSSQNFFSFVVTYTVFQNFLSKM